MKRREKKSESLDIRLPYQQKQDFMAATKQQGETASQVLRAFISDYIEEARLAEQPSKVQEISMTLARHRFKSIATAAGAAIGVFSVTALPSAADSTVFDHLDKNNDGILTEGEIAPGYDADIIEKLDTDGSGGVSQAELEAAGNEIVINRDHSETSDDGETVQRKTIKVIKFGAAEDGEIHGEVKTEVKKQVIVQRTGSGEELSEAELEALIEEALVAAEIDVDTETFTKIIIKDDDVDVDIE